MWTLGPGEFDTPARLGIDGDPSSVSMTRRTSKTPAPFNLITIQSAPDLPLTRPARTVEVSVK